MRIATTALPEVLVLEGIGHVDGRGSFMELWREDHLTAAGIAERFVQGNLARSHKGVLRGLHFQEPSPQGKLVAALAGAVFDVAVDIRRGSPRFGQWAGVELSAANRRQIWVPPGFAHGYCALTDDTLVHYACTAAYIPAHDRAVRWDDPALGIDWPVKAPILSEKDRTAPTLAEAPVVPAYRAAP